MMMKKKQLKRLKKEFIELIEKIDRLSDFVELANERPLLIKESELQLLILQRISMTSYLKILEIRIKNQN